MRLFVSFCIMTLIGAYYLNHYHYHLHLCIIIDIHNISFSLPPNFDLHILTYSHDSTISIRLKKDLQTDSRLELEICFPASSQYVHRVQLCRN